MTIMNRVECDMARAIDLTYEEGDTVGRMVLTGICLLLVNEEIFDHEFYGKYSNLAGAKDDDKRAGGNGANVHSCSETCPKNGS